MIKCRDALVIVTVVFILGILLVVFLTTKKQSDNLFNNLLGKKDFSKDIGSSGDENVTNSGEGAGEGGVSGGGDSGGGGGGGAGESSSQNCIAQQIAYSMLGFNKTEICNNYEGEICTDKTVYCSIEIQNRDDAEGNFETGLYFVEKYKQIAENFDLITRIFSLGANEIYEFSDSTQIHSTGEDGLANKEINCYYVSLKAPVKEIC